MPTSPETWHSLDRGMTWLPGKPTLDQERNWPGAILYQMGGTEPKSRAVAGG